MARIMRRPPMFNATPVSPQPISTNWQDTLYQYGQQYGPYVLPTLLSGLGGAVGSYNAQKFIQQPQPAQQAQQPTQQEQPQQAIPAQNTNQNQQMGMFDLLSQLISHRADMLGANIPSYPSRLFSQAVEASNSQQGSPQGPPKYTSTGPQFAFDQLVGGGAQYNPLSALGDFSQPQQPQKEWWRTSANQLGGLLQGLAPLAGTYGGLPGILGGAALGATGYGLRQL